MVLFPEAVDESSKEGGRPYWVEDIEALPAELRDLARKIEGGASRWLVFPDEQVGIDRQATLAVRSLGARLQICRVDDRAGLVTVSADDCSAIQFSNSLLRHEVTFFMADGQTLRITYNALGESAVSDMLRYFLRQMFSHSVPRFVLPSAGGRSPIEPVFQDTLNSYLPADEAFAVAVQAPAQVRGRGWFGAKSLAIPACAMAVSNRRLVVASGMSCDHPGRFRKSVTLIPAGQLDRIGLQVGSNGAATVGIGLGKSLAITLRYAPGNAMLQHLEQFVGACESLKRPEWRSVPVQQLSLVPEPVPITTHPAADAMTCAQQELLRLTGVDLPEAEAMEALVQIHNFKWLEAERAGFDTWAVIQPENPMRAAAVHWVRKYFSQFNQGRGAGQQIAS